MGGAHPYGWTENVCSGSPPARGWHREVGGIGFSVDAWRVMLPLQGVIGFRKEEDGFLLSQEWQGRMLVRAYAIRPYRVVGEVGSGDARFCISGGGNGMGRYWLVVPLFTAHRYTAYTDATRHASPVVLWYCGRWWIGLTTMEFIVFRRKFF